MSAQRKYKRMINWCDADGRKTAGKTDKDRKLKMAHGDMINKIKCWSFRMSAFSLRELALGTRNSTSLFSFKK